MTDKPMTDKTPERDRRIGLLGLMATESEKAGVCPSDEALAVFIEGQLEGEARRAMLAHLNHCPSCYCLQLGGLKPPPLGGSFSRFFVSLEA
jgi:putative zinc finger protein